MTVARETGYPQEPLFLRRSEVGVWDNRDTDTGRADGCSNTNIGPGRSSKEIDVALILPHPADIAQPLPPNLYLERMARADGCPEACGNYVLPSAVYDDPPRGFIANYLCTDCGYAWTTSWRDC